MPHDVRSSLRSRHMMMPEKNGRLRDPWRIEVHAFAVGIRAGETAARDASELSLRMIKKDDR